MRWRCALVLAAALAGGCADDEGRLRVYRVEAGDTLGHVAERFGVGSGAIVRLNELDSPNLIRAGAGLLLPDTDATADLPLYRPHRYRSAAPQACELARFGGDGASYDRVERWGCWTTDCLAVGEERRVCKCASDEGGRVFIERRDGTVMLGWPGAGFMGDTRRLEARVGDLDRDGREELVVASHRVTSNGMAVETWNLAILDGGDTSAPPVTFSVEGFGDFSFGVDPDTGACDLFATEWLDADDQRLGVGHYFVSRALAYAGGALAPRDAPLVAERAMPDARPELRDDEPLLREPTASIRWGTVARARRRPGEYHSFALDLEIELAGGELATFTPGDTYGVDSAHSYARLGDATTRRLLPVAYVPGDPRALEGRRVRIDGFGDAGTDLQWHVIWVE